MQIYFTFDYELYFGQKTGSVSKCIIEPTDMLLNVADKNGVKLVQFADAGFLLKLDEYRKKFPALDADYSAINNQLESLWKNNHDIQLHIHPHWEDCYYDGNSWKMNVSRYKLCDFSDSEISDIVKRYKSKLEEFTGPDKIYAFRAGGWCIQPFGSVKKSLSENGIRLDSSVFANGCYESDLYKYNFKGAPLKSKWYFEDNPLVETENGSFIELPITSIHNSPLFYWRLFLLGRINPYLHKPLGDGEPVASPGQRFSILTRWTHNTVSVDGYNAALLNRAYRQQKTAGNEDMVIIGHPKALSRYGLTQFEKFIKNKKASNTFTTFREQQKSFT